jgi:hypothetical protein
VGKVLPRCAHGNLVLSGIGGVFAGIAMTTLRAWSRKSRAATESFLSALFSNGLGRPQLDAVFWGRVALGGTIGFAVGAACGVIGIVSFPQFLSESGLDVLRDGTYPIVEFVGGGSGGAGDPGFWSWLWLFVVIVVLTLVLGFFAGLVLHLVVCGLAGLTQAGAESYTISILQERSKPRADEEDDEDEDEYGNGWEHDSSDEDDRPRPIIAGMARGAFTGILTGMIQGIFTVLGFLRL